MKRVLALLPLLFGACAAPTHLRAPEGVDRWEPSGAVALDDRLWVANDREGWIAAYALPLSDGVNTPVAHHAVRPAGLPRIKWEGAAPGPGGGLLLLEAFSRTVWHCRAPEQGCPELTEIDIAPQRARIEALADREVAWIAYEGLAADAERLLVGTRGLVEKGKGGADFIPWVVVLNRDAAHTFDGAAWPHAGRNHGLGAMALDGNRLWMTWSHEDEDDEGRSGVHGLIARAELNPETGLPERPRLCRTVNGKPEGLAVWDDKLIVTFDQDKARKDPADATKFDYPPDRDWVRVYDEDFCDTPGPALPE